MDIYKMMGIARNNISVMKRRESPGEKVEGREKSGREREGREGGRAGEVDRQTETETDRERDRDRQTDRQ